LRSPAANFGVWSEIMPVNFSNWAVVAYNDDTGLGRMAQDIQSVLGVRQLVIPSERLQTHPLKPGRDALLRPDATEAEIAAMLTGLEGLILLERISWHPLLPALARRMGLRLACVPMWEWFRGTDTEWGAVDLFLCPSPRCLEVVRSYRWRNSLELPWTLDMKRLPLRRVSGPARVFFHNAGLVDADDRKGTRTVIEAFRRVRAEGVRLIVRLQKAAELPTPDARTEVRLGSVDTPAALYAEGDAAVQPSKMEGLGFMVLEPAACGVPTITTDSAPMSDYVHEPNLRVAPRWFAQTAWPARVAGIRHARLHPPRTGALVRAMEWAATHDLAVASAASRAWAESTFAPDRLRAEWSRALSQLL
jgi:glycosyltransferase involved in cell wall biosynthesis